MPLSLFRGLQQDPVHSRPDGVLPRRLGERTWQTRFGRTVPLWLRSVSERADDLTGLSWNRSFWKTKPSTSSVPVRAKSSFADAMETCLDTELTSAEPENRYADVLPWCRQRCRISQHSPAGLADNRKTDSGCRCTTRRVAEIGKHGYGVYARHHMFTRRTQAGDIDSGTVYPDPIDTGPDGRLRAGAEHCGGQHQGAARTAKYACKRPARRRRRHGQIRNGQGDCQCLSRAEGLRLD